MQKGPTMIPANNSPNTAGSFSLLKSSQIFSRRKVVWQVKLVHV